jgi:hypothetical protein
METNLTGIQKLIEEKALARFNYDFDRDASSIISSKIFNKVTNSDFFKSRLNKDGSFSYTSSYFAFQRDKIIYEKCKEYWLPIYIEEESKMFLEDVERLKEEVDNLLNSKL